MPTKKLGFEKELLILAFDHRGSFQSKMFGIKGTPTPEQINEIASYKQVIFEGFQQALKDGVPASKAGILVDEQFGTDIHKAAKAAGCMRACSAEKSGQDEFDFEYGDAFGAHIEKLDPTFVKVLVRYNPEDDKTTNQRQAARLKKLGDWLHANGRLYLFELLVPATKEQLARAGGQTATYDKELRPGLMCQAMRELQDLGVEPDIWKLEGVDAESDARRLAEVARAGGRDQVGVVILGRGENDQKVREWLKVAARVPAFIGFAIGRSIFWDALKGLKEGKHDRAAAVKMVANQYKGFVDVWTSARR